MVKFTIKDLAEGKCAVKNDGTVEELKKVLKAAFPFAERTVQGNGRLYYKLGSKSWNSTFETKLPAQSVKDFLEELEKPELPKRGDRILVSNDNNKWYDKIFVTFIPGAVYPICCVLGDNEEKFYNNEPFMTNEWEFWKPIPEKKVLEVTLEDVAKQFEVDEVKIVEKKG